jgi:hypothetical protein
VNAPGLLRRLCAALAAACAGAGAGAQAVPPLEGADVVFGIRLGVGLVAQMPACVAAPDGIDRLTDRPCWTADPRSGGRTAKVSRAVFAALGPVAIRSVREVDGVVVEVEAEFPPAQSSRVERHLRATKGAPAESERYQRHGRMFGLRNLMSHTWRSGGATLHFDEQSGSDMGLVRAFLDRWADEERRRGGG